MIEKEKIETIFESRSRFNFSGRVLYAEWTRDGSNVFYNKGLRRARLVIAIYEGRTAAYINQNFHLIHFLRQERCVAGQAKTLGLPSRKTDAHHF